MKQQPSRQTRQPLVSILLPICNSRHFLSDCLKSLLSQSYKNLEIIAYDDYSKDNSYQILKAYKKKDKRLRVYKNKKRYGMAICLNRALRRAKGTLIAFMDPNDIATRDRIRRQVSFLLRNPQIVVVGTQIAKTRFPQDHQTIVHSLLAGNSFHFETAMINRQMLPKDLLFLKQAAYPLLFSDLFLKLLPYGEMANLPWILQQRRSTLEEKQGIKLIPLLKLWLTSLTTLNYRLSLRFLFTPLIKQT